MNRRKFLAGVPLIALMPIPVVADPSSDEIVRVRVMYPANDKYRFHAIERRFTSLKDACDYRKQWRGAPGTVVDTKSFSWPVRKESLGDWALRNKPENCPARLFKCTGV